MSDVLANAASPAAWESFYVILGSSAAALTGLQFVVVVLGAEVNVIRGATTGAFATPTIVHFCAVLLISEILSAPWPGLRGPALALGACGVAGVVYGMMVVRRARQQTFYRPVFEDWLWHGVLPIVAYAALLVAAVTLPRRAAISLFVVGATAALLLFVGIHNAWDSVIYLAQKAEPKKNTPPAG